MVRVAFAIGDYPPEERRLREDVAKSYASADVEVGIVSVGASPYNGLGPAEIQLVAPYYHAAYLEAERLGFDAVVPLGMLDLGVDGGRSLVDIPVIALRRAFDAAMTDPEFLDEADRLGLEVGLTRGEDLQKIVNDIISAPPPALERMKAMMVVHSAEAIKGKPAGSSE